MCSHNFRVIFFRKSACLKLFLPIQQNLGRLQRDSENSISVIQERVDNTNWELGKIFIKRSLIKAGDKTWNVIFIQLKTWSSNITPNGLERKRSDLLIKGHLEACQNNSGNYTTKVQCSLDGLHLLGVAGSLATEAVTPENEFLLNSSCLGRNLWALTEDPSSSRATKGTSWTRFQNQEDSNFFLSRSKQIFSA